MSAPRIVVFAGPTIDAATVLAALGPAAVDATVLGPVRQGDVMRACRLGARVVLLIDGYFQSVPAVWHKEILWALSHDVHVFGAASMGALRAAELHTFGMTGIGTIFGWYRDGVLERDDEVAVSHASAEHMYRASSEALVNIRATLARAVAAAVLDAEDAGTLLGGSAALFYPDRTWSAVLADSRHRLGEQATARLRAFLDGGGRVDQKRADALALLEHVRGLGDALATPPRAHFALAHTVWFDKLYRSAGEFAGDPGTSTGVSMADLGDELRLHGRYGETLRRAMLRRLAAEEAARGGVTVAATDIAQYANQFCHRRGLTDQATFDAWLAENQLTLAAFNALVEAELRGRIALADVLRRVHAELADTLRVTGAWPALARRAAQKVELLAAAGLADPGLDNTPFADDAELAAWWAAQSSQPHGGDPLDIPALGRAAEFTGHADFIQALLREYCARALGLPAPGAADLLEEGIPS